MYDIQLESNSVETDFTPYTGTTYPVDWTDTAGTVYGGYVDLVSGVLVATQVSESFDLKGRTYTTGDGFDLWLISHAYDATSASDTAGKLCDRATYSYSSAALGSPHFYIGKTTLSLFLPEGQHRTDTVQFVYPLLTPVTYQLTPQTIAMLAGTNNVWSNANGNVELTYYAQ